MIALSLYLPQLGTDLVRRRARLDPRTPILLSRVEHQREVVASCCARASSAGVVVGMTVSQAKALLPSKVHHEAWDGARLTRALRTLARRAQRFTPLVIPDADGLWLDCAGCEHLFGGMRRMAARVAEDVGRAGLACRVGVAPSMGAAWAVARFGTHPIVFVPRDRLSETLAPLPIEALRLTTEAVARLRSVSIDTIADVLHVPRDQLAERCGADTLRRMDQAFGRQTEVFEPVRETPIFAVAQEFDGPSDRPEAIGLCVRQLLLTLAERLRQREAGCRELRLTLRRSDLPPLQIIARASGPTRDPAHWYTLLRASLERAHLGFGVEGVSITPRGVGTLAHRQAARWLDTREHEQAESIARLADTLASRLGADRVLRARPRASHVPERAWQWEVVTTFAESAPNTAPAFTLDRPTLLLAQHQPVEAVHLYPDGPIGSLRLSGSVRRVLRSFGPERVCGEWWRVGRREVGEMAGVGGKGAAGGDAQTRDYYRVQTDDGAWLWVYRHAETGRWFLHGEWA